jgi:heme-degrading monooxygenase HmoA
MFARVTTVEGGVELESFEEALRMFHELALPAVQGHPGFQGVYQLADAPRGKLLALSLWESEAAMQASAAAVAPAREQVAQALGALVAPTVELYTVVAHHGARPA